MISRDLRILGKALLKKQSLHMAFFVFRHQYDITFFGKYSP